MSKVWPGPSAKLRESALVLVRTTGRGGRATCGAKPSSSARRRSLSYSTWSGTRAPDAARLASAIIVSIGRLRPNSSGLSVRSASPTRSSSGWVSSSRADFTLAAA